MIAAILTYLVRFLRICYRAGRRAVRTYGWPRVLAVVAAVWFVVVFGPERIVAGIRQILATGGKGVAATGRAGRRASGRAWRVTTRVARWMLALPFFIGAVLLAAFILTIAVPGVRSAVGSGLLIALLGLVGIAVIVILVIAFLRGRPGIGLLCFLALVSYGLLVWWLWGKVEWGSMGYALLLAMVIACFSLFAAAAAISGRGGVAGTIASVFLVLFIGVGMLFLGAAGMYAVAYLTMPETATSWAEWADSLITTGNKSRNVSSKNRRLKAEFRRVVSESTAFYPVDPKDGKTALVDLGSPLQQGAWTKIIEPNPYHFPDDPEPYRKVRLRGPSGGWLDGPIGFVGESALESEGKTTAPATEPAAPSAAGAPAPSIALKISYRLPAGEEHPTEIELRAGDKLVLKNAVEKVWAKIGPKTYPVDGRVIFAEKSGHLVLESMASLDQTVEFDLTLVDGRDFRLVHLGPPPPVIFRVQNGRQVPIHIFRITPSGRKIEYTNTDGLAPGLTRHLDTDTRSSDSYEVRDYLGFKLRDIEYPKDGDLYVIS